LSLAEMKAARNTAATFHGTIVVEEAYAPAEGIRRSARAEIARP